MEDIAAVAVVGVGRSLRCLASSSQSVSESINAVRGAVKTYDACQILTQKSGAGRAVWLALFLTSLTKTAFMVVPESILVRSILSFFDIHSVLRPRHVIRLP